MTTIYVMVADAENSNGIEIRLFFTRKAAMEAACDVIDGWSYADEAKKVEYKKTLDQQGYVEGWNSDTVNVREQVIEGGSDTVEPLVPDEEVQRIVPFVLTAANNFHDMVMAMQEAAAAIDVMSTQIEQMKGLFPDEDGTIAEALEDGLCADQIIYVTLGKLKEGLK